MAALLTSSFLLATWTPPATAAQSPPASRVVGQIGGPTQAVTAHEGYAYLGVGFRLIVLDTSDPTAPREVGASAPFVGAVRDVAVSGTIAYVATGGAGLRVLDVSDPTRPAEIGSLQSPGYAEGVAVSGTTVYLAQGPYGLRVIDVSNPRNPTEIGFAFTQNYAFKVAVDRRYAYVAAAGAGLLIADVTNPAKPAEVTTLATPGYAYGLAVSDNTAYVAGGWEGLLTVDVTSRDQPRLLGQHRTTGWAFGVTLSGTQACVAAGQDGVRLVDVSDPAHPTEISGLAVAGGDAGGVVVAGTIAYVADRNWGLEVVDLSSPASPVQVGFYNPLAYADGVSVTGNYAYVAAGLHGLRIVDISDPARPRQVGKYDTQSYAKSVVVDGDYAYVAANSVGNGQGLHVVDVRDPARPARAGFLSDPVDRDIALAGGIVYIADEHGLALFDVSDPTAPKKLSFLPTRTGSGMNNAVGVAVSGNVAFVAIEQLGLLTVDVSNPSAPAVIGHVQWPGAFAQDVVVAQGKAFVADQSALTVLDVSNPRTPVWLKSYPTSGFEESLTLAGNQAFVASGGAGLSVINVSNPGSPTLAWSYRTPGYAESVFVRDDLIFVGDSSGGLLILGTPGRGATTSHGAATPSRPVVSRAVTQRVSPPPVRASGAPLSAARSVGQQSASSCVVTSTSDSGGGTLRDCLKGAASGATITFDAAVFPPDNPATIAPVSELPHIVSGNVTIDASNAGVILDGSGTPSSTRGLGIGSDANIIVGLQIVRFPSDGVTLFRGKGNLIGGSRNRGNSLLGEGNLISGNGGNGINISDPRVANTTITGNFIGTDITGTAAKGNKGFGIMVYDSPNNRIGGSGPDERNVISGNSGYGIEVIGSGSAGNSISGNYIGVDASGTKALSNGNTAVGLEIGANASLVQGNVIVSTSRNDIVINDWGSSYNTVAGNLLGTDASGKALLGSAEFAIGVGGGAAFNRIGGVTPADRNVIAQGGISFGRQGGPGNLVIGNFIGTDISGSMTLAKRGSGIGLSDGSNRPFIGGTTAGERNVISGNPYGGIRVGLAADYTFIGRNYVGTDASGQAALGNGWSGGIEISQGTHIIVQGNLIAHHKGTSSAGITVSGSVGNTLRQNLIFDNQSGGIILKDGGNAGVSPPIITSVGTTRVSGTACRGCTVEVFSDKKDQAQFYEGSAVADRTSGAFEFTTRIPLAGANVTATATDASGTTSALSRAQAVGTAAISSSRSSSEMATTNATASLTAPATGTPTPAVPWQANTNGGVTLVEWVGAKGTTDTSTAAQTADDLFNDQVLQRIDLLVNTKDWDLLRANYLSIGYYPANMTWNGITTTNVAISSRETGRRSSTKPALHVDFNRFATGRRFLGLTSVNLDNLVQDASNLREVLATKFYRAMGIPAPRAALVALYVNNTYFGLYAVVEEIDEAAVARLFGEGAGYLFEFRSNAPYNFEYLGSDLTTYAMIDEPRTRVTESVAALYAPIEAAVRTINDASDENFAAAVSEYVDLSAFMRLVAAQAFIAECDGVLGDCGANDYYVYRPAQSHLHRFIAGDASKSFHALDYPIDAGQAESVLTRRAMMVSDLRSIFFSTVLKGAALDDRSGALGQPGPGWLEREATRLLGLIRTAVYADTVRPYTNDEFDQAAAEVVTFARTRSGFAKGEVSRLASVDGRSGVGALVRK